MLSELSIRDAYFNFINQNKRKRKDLHQIHIDSNEAEKNNSKSSTTLGLCPENQSPMQFEEKEISGSHGDISHCLKKTSAADANFTLGNEILCTNNPRGRKNVCGKEKKTFHFTENFLKRNLDATSIRMVTKLFTDISRLDFTMTEHLKRNFDNQFFRTALFLYETFSWNATSYILQNETKMNMHLVCRHHPRILKMPSKKHHSDKSSSNPNNFKPSLPALGITDKECKITRQLNLSCIFTKDVDSEIITSNLNATWTNEDIKMVLPIQWNIVVAYNVITASDENKHIIRILFRNPLKFKAETDSELFSLKNSSLNETIDSIRTLGNDKMKTKNSHNNLATINRKHATKKNVLHESAKMEIKKENYISLQKPLLLNCIKGKEVKQILMYKAHSLSHYSEKENKSLNKILEDLVSRSVRYEGEPINLIFDPLKVINNLKQEEGINSLIQLHLSKGKHDLTKNSVFRICTYNLKGKRKLNKTLKENGGFRNVISKTVNVTSEKSKHQHEVSDKQSNQHHARCPLDSMPQKNISPITVKDNTHSVTNENPHENKQKLKIRRQKSRTSLKRVNIKKIVKSVFRNYFHFYSLLGGHLRSGAVITKSNSNYWLKVSGVATDSSILQLAGDLFTATAGTKVVLNIYDYLKFLTTFARSRKVILAELVEQMMACGSKMSIPIQKYQTVSTLKNQTDVLSEVRNKMNQLKTSQSMPNLKNAF